MLPLSTYRVAKSKWVPIGAQLGLSWKAVTLGRLLNTAISFHSLIFAQPDKNITQEILILSDLHIIPLSFLCVELQTGRPNTGYRAQENTYVGVHTSRLQWVHTPHTNTSTTVASSAID